MTNGDVEEEKEDNLDDKQCLFTVAFPCNYDSKAALCRWARRFLGKVNFNYFYVTLSSGFGIIGILVVVVAESSTFGMSGGALPKSSFHRNFYQ